MTKDDYVKCREGIEQDMKRLKTRLFLLKEKFISDNRIFEDGDKIQVTTPARDALKGLSREPIKLPEINRFAFVEKAIVHDDGFIDYSLFKCKKDGTPSKQKEYHYRDILTPLTTN